MPGSPRALLALATPRRHQSPDYFRRIAGTVYGGQARRDPDALLPGSIAQFSETPSVRGYVDQLYAISFWTGVPWLWRLSQPTLVLAGDDDPIVPAINGRILAGIIPDARLEIIPGGGHLFPLERPAEIAALVAEFLAADRDRTRRDNDGAALSDMVAASSGRQGVSGRPRISGRAFDRLRGPVPMGWTCALPARAPPDTGDHLGRLIRPGAPAARATISSRRRMCSCPSGAGQ